MQQLVHLHTCSRQSVGKAENEPRWSKRSSQYLDNPSHTSFPFYEEFQEPWVDNTTSEQNSDLLIYDISPDYTSFSSHVTL